MPTKNQEGVHECISDPSVYKPLESIKDFRKYLSNFDDSVSFVWQGPFDKPYTFRSIEHAFQAAKIHIANPAAALKFTVESGDAIGLGDGALAQKKRKLVKLTPEQLKLWSGISNETMKSIAIAKYTQNPDSIASTVLKNTKDAELWHIVTCRGKPSELVRFEHLEYIRLLIV